MEIPRNAQQVLTMGAGNALKSVPSAGDPSSLNPPKETDPQSDVNLQVQQSSPVSTGLSQYANIGFASNHGFTAQKSKGHFRMDQTGNSGHLIGSRTRDTEVNDLLNH